jgi:hypothetical protein
LTPVTIWARAQGMPGGSGRHTRGRVLPVRRRGRSGRSAECRRRASASARRSGGAGRHGRRDRLVVDQAVERLSLGAGLPLGSHDVASRIALDQRVDQDRPAGGQDHGVESAGREVEPDAGGAVVQALAAVGPDLGEPLLQGRLEDRRLRHVEPAEAARRQGQGEAGRRPRPIRAAPHPGSAGARRHRGGAPARARAVWSWKVAPEAGRVDGVGGGGEARRAEEEQEKQGTENGSCHGTTA